MQTTNLNPALSPNNALQRNGSANGAGINVANGADAGQFSAMLSSQLAQAPAAPQPPAAQAPSPKPEAAKPAQPEQPSGSEAPAPAPAPQANGQDKTASADGAKDADAKDGDDGADVDKSAAQALADPASAMLALLASLQPGAKQAPATPTGASQAFDNLSGNAGKGKRFDANQLSALQAAIKSSSKDGAGATGAGAAADGKTFGAATIKNPALAAAGAALAADDKAAALGADKTAAGDVPGKVSTTVLKADPSVSLDAAALSLQQARAAAEQAAQNPAPVASALQAVQPAALDAAQATAAADQLSAQVGTEAWENQVGQKVVYMVGSEEQTASLTLNPPDLGPMQVVLSVSNDQASVTFSSNQQEVRQALENALPRLREMMSESGIALGNASVNDGDQGQARQQDGSPRGGRGIGRARGIASVDEASGTDAAPRTVTRSLPLGESGMVDTFA